MLSHPHELLLQALENVARSFGGNSGRLLTAVVNEFKRLERYEEDQETRRINQKMNDARKEFKATGKWPEGFGKDDDIPF